MPILLISELVVHCMEYCQPQCVGSGLTLTNKVCALVQRRSLPSCSWPACLPARRPGAAAAGQPGAAGSGAGGGAVQPHG